MLCSNLSILFHRGKSPKPAQNCETQRNGDTSLLQGKKPEESWGEDTKAASSSQTSKLFCPTLATVWSKIGHREGGDWQINDKIHSYLTHDVDLESMGVDNFAVILLLNYRKRRGPWIFRPCWQNGKMKSPRMWHTWTSGPGGWHRDRTG